MVKPPESGLTNWNVVSYPGESVQFDWEMDPLDAMFTEQAKLVKLAKTACHVPTIMDCEQDGSLAAAGKDSAGC
jgi:hypothetical protein